MAWSGGTFTRSEGSTGCVTKAAGGIGIEATLEDDRFNDFATGINSCLNKDGSNPATANLDLGGFLYTNAGLATARTNLARVSQVQDGAFIWGGTSGGSANAQTVTFAPAITALVGGIHLYFKAGFTNTASTTLNPNGIGASTLKDPLGNNLVGGEILSGSLCEVMYDGTNLVLLSHNGGFASYTPTYGGSGSLTFGTVTTERALYQRRGKLVTVDISAVGTTGGVASTDITISLPIGALNDGYYSPAPAVCNDGGQIMGYCRINTQINIRKATEANWGLGASRRVELMASYIAA